MSLKTITITLLAASCPVWAAESTVKVSLHPAATAIAPGARFDVGIRFDVPEGWHIYWKNPGDAGMPPRVDWKLPPGFQVGVLRFPAPKVHVDPGNLVTNVLDGETVLLQSLVAPEDLEPGRSVTLAADVHWMVRNKRGVEETAAVSVKLPVGEPTSDLDPRHQAVLQRARRALPIPADRGKHVKVTPSVAVQTVRPGQTFEVVFEVAVPTGTHIQSNRPPIKAFIATHVFIEPDPGLDFGKVKYPPPQEHTHPQLGRLSEYRGKVKIRVPVEVREDAEGEHVRIAGILTSQACNDRTGTCYPPEHVAWALAVPLDRSGAAPLVSEVAQSDETATEAETPVQTGGEQFEGILARLGLPGLLLGCFLYGLFINATPCVLPLLSIKVLGFVQQAHESRGRTLLLGLAFGAGVILFFVILGFLAAAGKNVLQYPAVVIALGAVVMALALSMLGVYTLQVPTAATKLEAAIQREGLLSSFGKGALAPVLGFACTGPLLAGAFGWATQQPPPIAVIAFLFAGLGMASPYMLLGANPKWLSFLPKPGPWMLTFERIMGFVLLAMVVWLLHPLVAQMGAVGLEWTLAFLVAVGMACWVLGRIDVNMSAALRWRYRGGATGVVLGAGALIYGWAYAKPASEVPWEPWSPEAVQAAVRSGKTVLVDFTTAYCTLCKANKRIAFNTPEVVDKILALDVVPLQGDYTSGDERIFAVLQKHNRPGVPLNLIYPGGRPDEPIVLRTNLTKQYLLEKLDEAGPSSDATIPALPP